MSDLRKMNSLQKKANYNNGQIHIDVDIITEDNPKSEWDYYTWKQYYLYEKSKGNKVIYLGDFNEGHELDFSMEHDSEEIKKLKQKIREQDLKMEHEQD